MTAVEDLSAASRRDSITRVLCVSLSLTREGEQVFYSWSTFRDDLPSDTVCFREKKSESPVICHDRTQVEMRKGSF